MKHFGTARAETNDIALSIAGEEDDATINREVSSTLDASLVQVAIIVPIYKHPGLLIEAITSALRQTASDIIAIILVNDGCPFEETHSICAMYTHIHKNLYYIHKENGGLSSARNSGIDFSLAAFECLEALYLLDADNYILPGFIEKGLSLLRRSPENVGWIYPDINKFGLVEIASPRGPYNPLEHLCWNFCEAGSLIRTEMFRTGLRFDERMKSGYEDWEFWLQGLAAGYRGLHLPASGFRYRQRAESMLKESERMHSEILNYIKIKHKTLFSARNVVEFEGTSYRFACYYEDSDTVEMFTDPNGSKACMPISEYVDRIFLQRCDPTVGGNPHYIIVTNRQTFALFSDLKILAGVLWNAERHTAQSNAYGLQVSIDTANATRIALEYTSETDSIHFFMTTTEHLVSAPDADFADSVLQRLNIDLSLVDKTLPPIASGIVDLYQKKNKALSKPLFVEQYTPIQAQRSLYARPQVYWEAICSIRPPLPITPNPMGDIGLILPVLSFGGVEKVAIAYAAEITAAGGKCHFFVSSLRTCVLSKELISVASTITIINERGFQTFNASNPQSNYFGAPLSEWHNTGDTESVVAALSLMTAVINFNLSDINPLMSRLRKLGVKTMTSQHLVDISPFGQPEGTPHQILAFEHAYDRIIVISKQLQDWFLSMGVPRAKLMLVRNGPGYYLSDRTRQRNILYRFSENQREGLRVLFIGRFDRQKGIDRLEKLMSAMTGAEYNISWRVVGDRILSDDVTDNDMFGSAYRPAVHSAKEIDEHYCWADVLVLLSRFEGVPLSIIEAGRLGCIPVCTDVGAVSEIVTNGETGFLVDGSENEIVVKARDVLVKLSSDAQFRRRMSKTAISHFSSFNWKQTTNPLLSFLGLKD